MTVQHNETDNELEEYKEDLVQYILIDGTVREGLPDDINEILSIPNIQDSVKSIVEIDKLIDNDADVYAILTAYGRPGTDEYGKSMALFSKLIPKRVLDNFELRLSSIDIDRLNSHVKKLGLEPIS